MKKKIKEIVPYRIKQARISRGYSILDLSELLDVSKQAISQYELGKHSPSKLILLNMSRILNYPVEFFYKPILVSSAANSAVFFRSRKSTAVKSMNAAKEKIEIFREITDYLAEYVNFPVVDFPKIDYIETHEIIENESLEEYANTLRQHWKLGAGPIDNLTNIVQKNGIMLSKSFLKQKKIDAFSVWFDSVPYIFLSDNKSSNVRTRFDIAHELGHLLMHADCFSNDDLKKSIIGDKLEDEANRFAGAFLMPKETFSKDVYSSSIDHFIQLKKKWKTSIASMIYRCETLGLLTDNQIKYLKDQMTSRVYWRREPLDNTMPIEKPFVHKQAINLILDNNVLTQYDITESICCFPSEIEEYCFLEPGTLSNSNLTDNVIKLR